MTEADETAQLRADLDDARRDLAAVHEKLRLTELVLARTTIDLATCTARLRIAERVIERLA